MRRKIANLTIILLVIGLGGSAGLLFQVLKSTPDRGADFATSPPSDRLELSDKDLVEISSFIDKGWHGMDGATPAILNQTSEGVYLAARQAGKRHADVWGHGDSAAAAMTDGIQKLRAALGPGLPQIDTLEIFIIAASREVESDKQLFSNIRRGIHGLEIRHGEQRTLYSPTYAVASNRKNERLIELYVEERKLSDEQAAELRFRFLRGPQLLVSVGPQEAAKNGAVRMQRGNTFQSSLDVTQASVDAFAKRMGTWMTKNLRDDGRMTYLYWPSRNEEAVGRQNLIRQFMASIALGRIAARLPPEEATQAWERSANNISYNLQQFYRTDGELGFVEWRNKAKLGAIALAALAIVEHANRQQWSDQEKALLRTVDSLWQADGSFQTFYKPDGRNDNQNFYPGEALLLWATLYDKQQDEALLAKFMKSFAYYRAWHMDPSVPNRRNPAFTPWHTQAYYLVWTHTKNEELREFIFEMNDWLVPIQEWDNTRYRDTKGRFYDASRPFGPPHASSTGVYLEGLVDAYLLARDVDDKSRMLRYATTIQRGLRSSMQLQFVDDVDMFYIGDRDAVFGGLRTAVYNNQIRCDNVQHTLMGTQKILEAGLLPKEAGLLPKEAGLLPKEK